MEDEEMYQGSLFEEIYDKKIINKPIKLIELFSGIGAQAKALETLGIPFEHHKTCEWAYNSIIGYNAIHIKDNTDYAKDMTREQLLAYLNGNISINYNEPADLTKKPIEWLKNCYNNVIATHNMMSIMNVKGRDLDFTKEDTKKYDFLMTYSFPCQDLSLAGKRAGMETSQAEGGTRSGLLWEVERILLEREKEQLPLPNILMMENVPEVIGADNEKHFLKWCHRLTELGYQNYFKILNAKNYGIPQNRRRCFMISILGDYTYDFPLKVNLKYRLKNILDKNVDEKYYLSKSHIDRISNWKAQQDPLKDIEKEKIISPTLTARGAGEDHSGMVLVSEQVDNYVGTYQYAKSENFMNGKDRFTPNKETNDCIQTSQKEAVVIKEEQTLKTELCNKLVENGLVEEGDIVKHSYTGQILSGNKKCVEKSDEMITLTTRGDCVGVCVNDDEKVITVGNYGSGHHAKDITSADGLMPTITTGNHGLGQTIAIKNATERGYLLAEEGDGIDISGRMESHRGTVQKGMSQTLTCQGGNSVGVVSTKCAYTELEQKLFTEDGNIKRYIDSNIVDEFKDGQMATTTFPNGYGHGTRVHDDSITLNTIDRPSVKQNLRIRKLTPCECIKLMGFERKDYEALANAGLSDSAIYHCAGDSIVTTVIMGLIGTMTNKDYRKVINDYVERIVNNE